MQIWIRGLRGAARSAVTAHSECELQRSRSGHASQDRTKAALTAQRSDGYLVDDRRDDDRQPFNNLKEGPLVAAEP